MKTKRELRIEAKRDWTAELDYLHLAAKRFFDWSAGADKHLASIQAALDMAAEWTKTVGEHQAQVNRRLAAIERRLRLLVTLQTGTWRERRAARKKLRGLA